MKSDQEVLIRELKDSVYKICARWTRSYSIPKFYRTPMNEDEKNSNKLVKSIIEFCQYLENKHDLPKNSLIRQVFSNDQYNDLVVAFMIKDQTGGQNIEE